jgi:hypothetical protein
MTLFKMIIGRWSDRHLLRGPTVKLGYVDQERTPIP